MSFNRVDFFLKAFASTDNITDYHKKEKSYSEYIFNIRSLLNQTVSAYLDNHISKAKEFATSAYLDNFEYLEKPIDKVTADQGEDLMRVHLRGQIDAKEPIDEIIITVDKINKLLDEVEKKLEL
ncbi:MAG: hypothetical protein R2685_09910 [Candidatus Nitrosocosmicus sp.]|nr:hypothetical protein [Candidatus Nitrosocosmicus sp.]